MLNRSNDRNSTTNWFSVIFAVAEILIKFHGCLTFLYIITHTRVTSRLSVNARCWPQCTLRLSFSIYITRSLCRTDCRRSYKEVKENMYSPSIKHRLEPRTEGQPSFGASPPGMQRVQPQAAGYSSPRIQYPAPLHLLNHGPSKIVITKHSLKPGTFISDFKVRHYYSS